MDNFVITIARGFGSGGRTIGNLLAEELNINCYEHRILKMASEVSGLNESLFVKNDEKLKGGYLLNVLKGIPIHGLRPTPEENDFVSDMNIFNIQSEVIKNLAKTESCVIVGKCADFVLRDFPNVISVYIEAPRELCVENIKSRLGVTSQQAAEMIRKTDKYRADYYKYYSGGCDWTNPINYDLTINTGRVGRDECIRLIKEYVNIRFGRQGVLV